MSAQVVVVSRPRRQRSAGSPSVTDRHDEATGFFDGLGRDHATPEPRAIGAIL